MTAATAIPEFTRELWTDGPAGEDTTTSLAAPRHQSAQRRITGTVRVVRIVPDPRDEETLGTSWEKVLFQIPGQLPAFDVRTFVAELTAELSQIGFPGDAMTSSTPWPLLWRQAEPDAGVWRGVFAFHQTHTEIFSDAIVVDLRSLPRLAPHITLARRMLETDDE